MAQVAPWNRALPTCVICAPCRRRQLSILSKCNELSELYASRLLACCVFLGSFREAWMTPLLRSWPDQLLVSNTI